MQLQIFFDQIVVDSLLLIINDLLITYSKIIGDTKGTFLLVYLWQMISF